MNAKRSARVLAVVCCMVAPPGASQTAPPVEEGSRVRLSLTGPDEKRLTGTVATVGGESLSLMRGSGRDTTVVPLRTISRLELSRGRRSMAGGALVGGAIGAGLGAAGTLVWVASSCFKTATSTGGNCPTGGTAAGIVLGGGAAGALLGVLIRPERWLRVAWTGVRASVGPGGARVEIGL